MVVHETTEENNETANRRGNESRIAKQDSKSLNSANSRNREWQTRERRGLPVHRITDILYMSK